MNLLRRKIVDIITILFLVLLSTKTFAENIDLFIFAGQSNAQGFGTYGSQYPTDTDNLDNQIRFNWTKFVSGNTSNGWTTMGNQTGGINGLHFGPEVTFSRKLKLAGYNPAIFKYTQPSTSIYVDWKTPGDGGWYDTMVVKLNTAITQLENQGHTVTIRGFIWIQGEADSKQDINRALTYKSNLSAILAHIRGTSVANDPSLPVIIGVDEQNFNVEGTTGVLNAQLELATDDPYIKYSTMWGLPKFDFTHLNSQGAITQGEQIFDIYENIKNQTNTCGQEVISSSGSSESGDRKAWGQTFIPQTSGYLSQIVFGSSDNVNTPLTLTLYDGVDCDADVINTVNLSSLVIGDNTAVFNDEIFLTAQHTYYFKVLTNNGSQWSCKFNLSNQVFGTLRRSDDTDQNPSTTACDHFFKDFDMNFSVSINPLNVIVTENNSVLSTSITNATYEWLDCDNGNVEIQGETNQSFTPVSSGNYAVRVFKNGCTEVSDCYSLTTLSLPEVANTKAKIIYKNVSENLYSIQFGQQLNEVKLTIFDSNGNIIQENKSFQAKKINFSILGTSGVYFISIKAENFYFFDKVIKL